MFQWMGGSRRKVTTSRKSTHKRQKQYFEQRKRQQQQQLLQTDCLESLEDRVDIGRQYQNRSLDILSLLNLSTISQEKNVASTGAEHISEKCKVADVNALPAKCHFSKSPSMDLHNKATPSGSTEFRETRTGTLSGFEVEAVPLKKDIYANTDNHIRKEVESKPDQMKTDPRQCFSVLHLLGDEGDNDDLAKSPIHEAHVAFSVQGLGKVGTETPPHSPPQTSRTRLCGFDSQVKVVTRENLSKNFKTECGFDSPVKVRTRENLSKNFNTVLGDFELEMDEMMQNIRMPCSGSSLEYSMGITDTHNNHKPELRPLRTSLKSIHHSKRNRYYGDRSIFFDSEKGDRDGGDRFLGDGDDILGEGEYDINDWSCQIDRKFDKFSDCGKSRMPENGYEGLDLPTRSVGKNGVDRFNFLEHVATRSKHQRSDYEFDTILRNGGRHPRIPNNFDFGGKSAQLDWSCSVTEDAMDSFSSLLSEESCSSTAGDSRKK